MTNAAIGHSPNRIDWGLSTLLGVQSLTLFVAFPLASNHVAAHLLLDICRMAFALVCIFFLTRHRGFQAGLIVALAILATGPAIERSIIGQHLIAQGAIGLDSGLQHALIEGVAFGFNLAVTVIVARHVFGPGRVTVHRVQGAVLLYLNIASLFAIAFNAIVSLSPGAIVLASGASVGAGPGEQAATFTYFSFATLTTTGYGDLVPIHPLARSLANLEAVIGQLFPATLLARVVALHLEHQRGDAGDDGPPSA